MYMHARKRRRRCDVTPQVAPSTRRVLVGACTTQSPVHAAASGATSTRRVIGRFMWRVLRAVRDPMTPQVLVVPIVLSAHCAEYPWFATGFSIELACVLLIWLVSCWIGLCLADFLFSKPVLNRIVIWWCCIGICAYMHVYIFALMTS